MSHVNAIAATGYSSDAPGHSLPANAYPGESTYTALNQSHVSEISLPANTALGELTSEHSMPLQSVSNMCSISGWHHDEKLISDQVTTSKHYVEPECYVISSDDKCWAIPADGDEELSTKTTSCYNAPSCSTLGLDDSLENIELCCDMVSSGKTEIGSCKPQSFFHSDLDPWTQTAEELQYHTSISSQNATDSSSTLLQCVVPKQQDWMIPKQREWRLPNVPSPSHLQTSDPVGRSTSYQISSDVNLQSTNGNILPTLNDNSNSLKIIPTVHTDSFNFNPLLQNMNQLGDLASANVTSTSSFTNTYLDQSGPDNNNLTATARTFSSSRSNNLIQNKVSVVDNRYASHFPVTLSSHSAISSHSHDFLIPRSSKVISSSIVRKPLSFPSMERAPLRALDLGLDQEKSLWLQSNDRTLSSSKVSTSNDPVTLTARSYVDTGVSGEIVRSKYFPTFTSAAPSVSNGGRLISNSRVSLGGVGTDKFANLKTFHLCEGGSLPVRQTQQGTSLGNNLAMAQNVKVMSSQ